MMFDQIRVRLGYKKSGVKNTVSFAESITHQDFTADIRLEKNGYQRLRISLMPFSELEIVDLQLALDFPFAVDQRIFVNGYQSWTTSREFYPDEKLRGVPIWAMPFEQKYQMKKYGDYTFYRYPFSKGVFHSYTYSYIRQGEHYRLVGSLNERNGFTIIDSNVKKKKITIKKDCSGYFIDKQYNAFDLIWMEGTDNQVFDMYFDLMEVEKPSITPMTGWTSWYNYYQNISEQIILENLENFDILPKIDIFQIDDGYQTAVGDWLSVDKRKFPNGMSYIADSIKSKGYKAGLWLAPFVCETNSTIFREKKEWLLKDRKGRPVPAGSNWSRSYALDFYHPEVRAHLKYIFDVVLNDWGYDMVKLDFLYAVCLISDKKRTRGQIMAEAMDFLRECAGDKLILGCGVPLGSAFGTVDFCRIGCDVSLDWDDKYYMKWLLRERISTRNTIIDTISRRHLDQRAFLNDPDVFLLRNNNTSLTEAQKKTLLTVNTLFGSLLFTSDNIKKYTPDMLTCIKQVISSKKKTIQQVEWYRNGLVEVVYTEDEKRYWVLINPSNRKVSVVNKYGSIPEVSMLNEEKEIMKDRRIMVYAFESRVFLI